MRSRILRAAALGLGLAAALVGAVAGCDGWDPRSPFERNAPEVNEALRELDAGRARPANETLSRYLGTGPCSADAGLALPPAIREKPNGSFDLGLSLFVLGEQYGQRFGEEDRAPQGQAQGPAQGPLPFKIPGHAGGGQGQQDQAQAEKRALEVGCALVVVGAIAADPQVPIALRARAYYLAGNLEFLRQKYEDAVKEYDQALALVPGVAPDAGGDSIGRDAAWNRAIALRRKDQNDAGPDSPPDADDKPDGSNGNDGSSGNDGGDKGDAGSDGGGKPDPKNDGGNSPPDGGDKDKQDGGGDDDGGGAPPPPPPAASQSASPQQDARLLEQLEQSPSYQGQEAKQRAAQRRRGSTMEDK